jgi:hemerythrin-like domain-containing protein
MLTFTYSLVTLSVEQKKAKNVLITVQEHFRNCMKEQQCIDQNCFESALNQLARFDESHHRRNVELYVIPAVQEATREADPLLAELESLSAQSEAILKSVRARVKFAFQQGSVGIKELCSAMDVYCHNLLRRLAKEEEELFPVAQRVISSEGWFVLASQFISHNEEVHAHRSSAFVRWQPVAPNNSFAEI